MGPALRGVLQTLAIVAAFAAAGLAAAPVLGGRPLLELRPPRMTATAYARSVAGEASGGETTLWLVDGFNVLHAGILQGRNRRAWWGPEARGRLLARARAFEDPEAEIWVVFDGRQPAPEAEPSPRVRVVFAASADEWLLRRVREAKDVSRLVVVTADRRLAARSRHRGARVVSPTRFLSRCREAPEPGSPADG